MVLFSIDEKELLFFLIPKLICCLLHRNGHKILLINSQFDLAKFLGFYLSIQIAKKYSPDEKNTVYLASALAIDSKFWSNDKKLKEDQKEIEVLTTEELIHEVGFIK